MDSNINRNLIYVKQGNVWKLGKLNINNREISDYKRYYKNIALNKSVEVSSNHVDSEGEYIVDGIKTLGNKRWISQETDNNPYCIIDLEINCEIKEIKVYSGHEYPNTTKTITEYSLSSFFNSTWQEEYETTVGVYEHTKSDLSIKANKVRFNFPPGYNRIYEIEVIGIEIEVKE